MKKENIQDIYRLSPIQEGILFHSLSEPKSATYFEQFARMWPLPEMDMAILQQALQRVIDRHAVLRTGFYWEQAQYPLQVVQHTAAARVDYLDWRHMPGQEQSESIRAYMEEERRRGFDLAQPPLLRVAIIRMAEDVYRLIWSHHHLILDGWSSYLVLEEFIQYCRSLSHGHDLSLAPARPYREYIAWLQQQDMSLLEKFWRDRLRGFATPTQLGIEKIATGSGEYCQEKYHILSPLAGQLRSFARSCKLTLNTLFQGAWALLLSYYSGQEDIVFGTIVSGRSAPLEGIENMVGVFINTLPMRVTVPWQASSTAWLGDFQQQQVELRQYEYSPLVQLQKWSEIPAGTPVFNNILAVESYPVASYGKAFARLSDMEVFQRTNYPLTMVIEPGEEILLRASFDNQIFAASAIRRLLRHFVNILEQIVASQTYPGQRLSDLQPLFEEEIQRLVVDWNTSGNYPQNRCLHQWFEEQVEKTPDAIAIAFGNRRITYRQANRMANRLARHLAQLGVMPKSLVAMAMEPCPEMVIAILAILKAQAAYVPIDPMYPQDRIAVILEDTQAHFLLTQTHLRDKLPRTLRQTPVYLDADWKFSDNEENLKTEVDLDSPAYVIYTSGSTGKPKGVIVSHRNVVRLFSATEEWYHFDHSDVWTLFHSYAFDFSVWEIWGALLYGGRLVVVPYNVRRLPDSFYELLASENVTVLNQTPSAFGQLILVDGKQPADRLSLRLVIFGGEKLELETLRPWFNRHGDAHPQLVNMYGITETTVHVTYFPIRAPHLDMTSASLIGTPLPDLQLYLLDTHRRLVPIGVPGEIYVGGAGVAIGYLNRPELTEIAFVPNHFSPRPERDRLYKTGDLARYREDGTLEFMGRIDHQIKIRGFRVELGEIEVTLLQHSDVRQAVILAREDEPGNKRLVAYVVPAEGKRLSISAMRVFVQEKLPLYMVPAAFVFMEKLPLTANGKIDRRALPQPDASAIKERAYVAPRDENEAILAQIWQEVLKIPQVGITDNFFELGGDSILSIQITSKARQKGLKLATADLFANPTIVELAATSRSKSELPAAQESTAGLEVKEISVPLTPIQQWFFAQNLPQLHHWNQAWLLQVAPNLDLTRLEQVVQKIVQHHDMLRSRYFLRQGQWHQEIRAQMPDIAIERLDLTGLDTTEQAKEIERNSSRLQASLDLEKGRVLALAHFKCGGNSDDRLLLLAHHLVVDGVSWRIILQDMIQGYRQCTQGQGIELSARTSSYRLWAEKLQSFGRSQQAARQADFWLGLLSSTKERIPIDDPDQENSESSAQTISLQCWSQTLTRQLLTSIPAVYHASINDLLLTALILALADWTGRQEGNWLIDMESYGREPFPDVDLERTVGWFTAIFPVLIEKKADVSIGEMIRNIKERLRRVPDRGIGYGILKYLSPDESLRAKLEQLKGEISFNYLGKFDTSEDTSLIRGYATEPIGPCRGMKNTRAYLLDINAIVVHDALIVNFTYSRNLHRQSSITHLTECYQRALQNIVAHCLTPGIGGFTPSDFSLIEIAQSELDAITAVHDRLEDMYPLTPMQRGMLFHTLLEPESGVYFEQLRFKIRGLDVASFRAAWHNLISQENVLRTSFLWSSPHVRPEQQQPLQLVHSKTDMAFVEQDWRQVSAEEQKSRLQSLFSAEEKAGFALDRAPLLKMTVIRLGQDQYQLMWNFHHILLDGWSLALIMEKLFGYYEAAVAERAFAFAPSPPYKKYIAWLQQQNVREAENYWRRYLAGIPDPTHLEIEKLSPKLGLDYATCDLELPQEEITPLESMVRLHKLTINTLLQGAWALVLSRYSQQREVIFGITVSGRSAAISGIENMIGLFINTLPLHVAIEEDCKVADYLQKLQEQNARHRQYEYTSLADIKKYAGLSGEHEIFDNILVFENYPVGNLSSQDRDMVEDVEFIEKTNYPLALAVFPGKTIRLKLHYDRHRYDATSMECVLYCLRQVLSEMQEKIDCPMSGIEMLSQEQRELVLTSWNQTQSAYPDTSTIHEIFAREAARVPQQIAVYFEGTELTYHELNTKANQLGHYLRKHGVAAETMVAICLDRSPEMIVAIWGILKAGGAYVPLDPSYPRERLAFMIQDAGVPILVTHSSLLDVLPGDKHHLVLLDEDWDKIGLESRENFDSTACADNLAYVIYTSGSTGTPKAVLLSHRGLCNLQQAQKMAFSLGDAPKVLQFSSLSFDASIWETMMALCCGGTLVLRRQDKLMPGRELSDFIEEQKISAITFPPSALAVMPQDELPLLNTIVVAGEACPPEIATFWVKGRSFYNAYGPSESTVCATVYQCNDLAKGLPIGKPIANMRVYLLDAQLRPVPVGVPGELCIAGVGLARGYLHRPDLTAEKFVPNPFAQTPGERLYRTGDLARYLPPDGNIEFLGRIDSQVKIRGFRIELGEIESLLAQHPQIQTNAVIMREDSPGNKRIYAYIVPREGQVPELDKLRAYLQKKLPNYMIPAFFVLMPALPLSPNGKVDRKTLPRPENTMLRDSDYVAPRSETEATLVEIWQKVLKLEKVGVMDNFFDVGGDSILTIQMVSWANQQGLTLSPRDIYLYPTIATLAQNAHREKIIHAEQTSVTGEVRLTPIEHWFFEQNLPHAEHWNQSLLLEIAGELDVKILEAAMRKVTMHHDMLRSRYAVRDGHFSHVIAPDVADLQIRIVDLRDLDAEQGQNEMEKIAQEIQASLDITHGRLVAMGYFLFATEQGDVSGHGRSNRLLIVVHHLVVDGVSWRILLESLIAAYEQIKAGNEVMFPDKTTSYRYWAEKLYELAQSERLKKQAALWMQSAALGHEDSIEIQQIPVDFPAGENREESTSTLELQWSSDETTPLLKYKAMPVRELLLTALSMALCKWAKREQASWVIDLEGHGREDLFPDVDITRTVGWFTSIYPVVLHKPAYRDVGHLLQMTRETMESIPEHGIGYSLLKYLCQDRSLTETLRKRHSQIAFDYSAVWKMPQQVSFVQQVLQKSCGNPRHLENPRPYLLEINATIWEGQLVVKFYYSQDIHTHASIVALGECYRSALSEIDKWLAENKGYSQVKKTRIAFTRDATLESSIFPTAVYQATQSDSRILLTGASGFLGAFLLHELMQKTQAQIYCLVRSENETQARERIWNNLETYGLNIANGVSKKEETDARLIPIVGDLAKPLLGLSPQQFQNLARDIDVIYHSGASVNLIQNYQTLKPVNVMGTQEILRLACQDRVKPVHHISTLSVFSPKDIRQARVVDETNIPQGDEELTGGYCQSKWVAEKLVNAAQQRGIPTCIYRTGTITAHSQTGACNTDDFLSTFIKGSIQLGCLPDIDIMLYLTPVDYIARSVVYLSQVQRHQNRVFHLSNPNPVSMKKLSDFLSGHGYEVSQVHYREWGERLQDSLKKGEENPLAPLLPMLQEELEKQSTPAQFTCDQTTQTLRDSSISCAEIDARYIGLCLNYMMKK